MIAIIDQITYKDHLRNTQKRWLLQCDLCLMTDLIPAIPGHLESLEEYVFPTGRFAGMTLETAHASNPKAFTFTRDKLPESDPLRDRMTKTIVDNKPVSQTIGAL